MSFHDHKGFIHSLEAASLINPGQPVTLVGEKAVPISAGTSVTEPFGVADASVAQGGQVTVYGNDNIVRAKAVASLGAGVDVGVGSTNGALNALSGASGFTKWRVGKSLEAAAAGETFAVYVSPRQLSNLI